MIDNQSAIILAFFCFALGIMATKLFESMFRKELKKKLREVEEGEEE